IIYLFVIFSEGQDDWGVTYTSTQICALRGSTVEMPCTYRYPSTMSHQTTEVVKRFWFTKGSNKAPVDLKTDSDYTGRVEYHCDEKSCILSISDLRERDSVEYKFKFITNHDGFTGSPGVTLSVTDGPKLPSVSVSPSAEIVEGSSVTLTCSSDANPAARYTWYKENVHFKPLSEGPQLVFSSIRSSDSGQYYCTAENELGTKMSQYKFIDVKYAPKVVLLSLTPTGDIRENSRVTLTCSSDANPAATYTWYKNGKPLNKNAQIVFSSIQSSDSGEYYCKAENKLGRKTSRSISIDVKCDTLLIIPAFFGSVCFTLTAMFKTHSNVRYSLVVTPPHTQHTQTCCSNSSLVEEKEKKII
uniref:Ig-like domain-containing protein n=1 Tax=Sander lucioperca TaxID=283035 RepID=A0A8D0CRA0_SANLU